ncbi:MAG TPA: hypothetical protein VIX61_10175 [Casimicrobiaceae bacterium]
MAVVRAAPAEEGDPLAAFRALEPATVERVLALDPARVTSGDVRDVLAHVPAPRIYLLQGSVAFVSMSPFAEFLIAMGYPEERLRNASDGGFSRSSYGDSATLAGEIAWRYERDGMMPMLIGHSQGGMLAIRALYELTGEFDAAIAVRDPATGEALPRTTIRDPLTGQPRPVVGLKLPYVAALATGKTMRVLLGQWSMLPRLRKIPDSVDEFTGYWIPGDPLAGGLWDEERYRAMGTARVRNVTLPASYSHIGLPLTAHLAADPVTRAWIDAYDPAAPLPEPEGIDTSNLTHAADIWYSVRRHWCEEAQRAVRAARPAS